MPVPSTYVRNAVSLTCRVSSPWPIGGRNQLCSNTPLRQFTTVSKSLLPKTRVGIPVKWSTRFLHSDQSNSQEERPLNAEKAHVHQILSLTPETFSAVGQEMVDFSTRRWVYAGKTPKWVVFSYPADPPAKKDNFPPDSRGYLYYRKPLPGEHAMAGGLRFRVMPLDTRSFDEGIDLIHKDGLPWRVPLYNIVHFKAYAPILETLLKEGSVTPDLVAHVQKMPVRRFSRRSAILYESSDTFIADLSRWPRFVHMIMPESVVTIDSFISRVFFCKSSGTSPYQGRLRLRLERSTLPRHADSYHATLRVVEIIEPIQCIALGKNFEIAEPIEGKLIRRRGTASSEYKIYTCKLSGGSSEVLDSFFNGRI